MAASLGVGSFFILIVQWLATVEAKDWRNPFLLDGRSLLDPCPEIIAHLFQQGMVLLFWVWLAYAGLNEVIAGREIALAIFDLAASTIIVGTVIQIAAFRASPVEGVRLSGDGGFIGYCEMLGPDGPGGG